MANSVFKSLSKTLLENSALAKRHGFTVGQTKSGNYVSIPLSQNIVI